MFTAQGLGRKKHRFTPSSRGAQRERERERDTHTHTHTDRQTERERDRDRQTDRMWVNYKII